MADDATLLYLEPDEEITSVVRRVREAQGGRVVLVAPGRAKATSSATALRLLARMAGDEGREVAVVGDALTRSLAAEADLTAFGTVDDARGSRPAEPLPPQRAAIHVLRGDEPTAAHPAPPAPATAPMPTGRGDETRVVPVARPAPGPRRRARTVVPARRRPLAMAGVAVVALSLVIVLAGAAAVLPGATVAIQPATEQIGPRPYELRFDNPTIVAGTEEATVEGTATGTYPIQVAASGAATFRNFNIVAVEVPAGTQVSASSSGIAFLTAESVVVPGGTLTEDGRIAGGEAAAPVAAVAIGPSGNLPAEAIDTIDSNRVRNSLRGFANNTARLVINYEATAGGVDDTGPEVTQADVDAALASLREQLTAAVGQRLEGTTGITLDQPAEPMIEVPDDLVGRRDAATFSLDGTLAYDRAAVDRAEVDALARQELAGDAAAVPTGHELVADSITVTPPDEVRRDGDRVIVRVEVFARSAPMIDEDAIRDEIAGRSIDEVRTELEPLGAVTITAWPGWVDAIPALTWRIEITIGSPGPTDPMPSGSAPASS
jgi:hypothetical protein